MAPGPATAPGLLPRRLISVRLNSAIHDFQEAEFSAKAAAL
jgi:hypothetical protein